MQHEDVLKLLFPIELTGECEADFSLEGKQLDEVQNRAEQLLREMIPLMAGESIVDWERVCGLIPDDGDTLQIRQARVVAKLRERGRLSIPFFTDIITTMGYTATIEELLPNTDSYGLEGIFRWRVTFTGIALYRFRAGQSCAGDSLLDGPLATALEGLLTDIKPAHTLLIFAYT